MGLFSSKFAKLEAFASTKADDRTPEMLQAAQAELSAAGAGLILVPQSETIKTGKDLENHIEQLQTAATTAKQAEEAAKTAATTAQEALTALKGERVLGSDKVTSDKGTGGDKAGEPSAEDKAVMEQVAELPHNQRAKALLSQD